VAAVQCHYALLGRTLLLLLELEVTAAAASEAQASSDPSSRLGCAGGAVAPKAGKVCYYRGPSGSGAPFLLCVCVCV
jgi:hypothetical protein